MADDVQITVGSGTAIGADEISSVKYQRIKLIHGADGVNAGDVATGNPLPVVQTGTPALPTGAATSANQSTGNTSLGTIAGAVAGTEMQVDVLTMPTVAVTQSGTWDEVGINDSGNSLTVDAPVGTPAFVRLSDGASAISTLPVSLASVPSHAVTNAGTFAVQESGGSLTALQIMDDWDNTASDGASVSGDTAHDAADAGEPVKIGGKAITAEITPVAANDRVNAVFDITGRQIVMPYALKESFVSGAITTAMTSTTSTSLLPAPAAGLRNYVTCIVVSNAHATVGTDVIIQNGSGGATLMTIPAAAVYGGAVVHLPVPLKQTDTATALFCANVTTGASTKVSAVGFTGT